jgi:hypothetical protein
VQVLIQLPPEPGVIREPYDEYFVRLGHMARETEAAAVTWAEFLPPGYRLVDAHEALAVRKAYPLAASVRGYQDVPIHFGHEFAGDVGDRAPGFVVYVASLLPGSRK